MDAEIVLYELNGTTPLLNACVSVCRVPEPITMVKGAVAVPPCPLAFTVPIEALG